MNCQVYFVAVFPSKTKLLYLNKMPEITKTLYYILYIIFCIFFFKIINFSFVLQKLVNEVFQTMWFTPLREKNSENKLLRRVVNITEVVI